MTDQLIRDYVAPSEELAGDDGGIAPDNLLDEVSLYNLHDDRESPEQDAEYILNITYPTETLKTIIENSAKKLTGDGGLSEGGHVIGGDYGSGKSHIELVLYHLFDSPATGRRWLADREIGADIPDETRTAALQMLNLNRRYDRLSSAVGEYLGMDEWQGDNLPTVHQIRDAIGDTPTAVFLDEFERWFSMEQRSEYRSDNLAFLQNLLEAAGREDTPLCVFVSLLYEDSDIEAVVQRTNLFTHDLSSRRNEKIQFLLHRLIGDIKEPEGLAALAKEYTDVYRQNDQIQLSDYHDMEGRIKSHYPFHPDTLALLMDKYSEQRSHQDARGLLRFLAEILRDNFDETDLILTGDISVFDYTGRFRFIDSGLVTKYLSDYHRLGTPVNENEDGGEKTFAPHMEELLNIVLLHSLARGGEEGANKRQMLMGVIRKGGSAYRVLQTFTEDIYGHAWHVHRINGEYSFDVDENPAARIEKKAEDVHKNDAIHRVERLVREELFDRRNNSDGRNNVHVLDPVNTEQDIPDNRTLKLVVSLAAKRSFDEEFEALTTGQEREWNNTIALVAPQKRSSVDTNTGIIELARKVVAGELLDREELKLPEGFAEIHDQNYRNLRDRVSDKYGTVYESTGRGLYPRPLSPNNGEDFYEAANRVLRPDRSQLEADIRDAVESAGPGGIQYEHLLKDFHRDTSLETLTEEQELRDALESLCRDGKIEVGNYFEERVRSLGSDTSIVHHRYVQTGSEEDDETEDIIVDTGSTPDPGSTPPESANEPEASGGGGTEAAQLDAEGNSETDDYESDCVEPSSVPEWGTIDADNKPDLIDTLERKLGIGWEIHEARVEIAGTLTGDDLDERGISGDEFAGALTTEETITYEPDTPISKQGFLSLLYDLHAPERATLSIKLQVVKNE